MAKARRPKTEPAASRDVIRVVGAREHNLRDVSLELNKGRLICFTGVSGSGKSSLAFDTLYAEGQRRYIESLSSYARQFIGELPRPNVDQISGLAPSISIQQKTSGWNPRSTVGTITQIHDYLRVLMARVGAGSCPQCGAPIRAQTREHMLGQILAMPDGTRFMLLAPRVRGQKGEHRDLFADLAQRGFARARVNGEVIDLSDPPELDRYRRHDIEVVIDRLVIKEGARTRIAEALELALETGDGVAIVAIVADDSKKPGAETAQDVRLSSAFACPKCSLSFEAPTPQLFSFNSPTGMCPDCEGLGQRHDFATELLISDPSKSFLAPCVAPMRTKPGRWRRHIYQGVADHFGFSLTDPWEDLADEAQRILLFGSGDEHITFTWKSRQGSWKHGGKFEGVIAELRDKYKKASSQMVRRYYEQFMRIAPCAKCGGARLTAQALAVRLTSTEGNRKSAAHSQSLNIHEICQLSIANADAFLSNVELGSTEAFIAEEPLKEIRARLRFLLDVGLDYLTLDRSAPTLSGGESQRIRLASQIGSGLVGVMYVLDEPSIGLHPRDNRRLLQSLTRLRDMGNTVIVVEHDRETMEAADEIVDFGPGPGTRGGRIVAHGDYQTVCDAADSLTGAYLSGKAQISTPKRRPIDAESRPARGAPPGEAAENESPRPKKPAQAHSKPRIMKRASD
ncbi:MAG: excinuclease ABC subunit UvrA [Phycisphaerales bacterium]|nr:excinuclease ABC subunit UvrA [Phycisphaerales bacterium]